MASARKGGRILPAWLAGFVKESTTIELFAKKLRSKLVNLDAVLSCRIHMIHNSIVGSNYLPVPAPSNSFVAS